jgi:hypothetical protein
MIGCVRLTLSFLILTFAIGCYSYRNVKITVLDAESREPIPNASVRTFYEAGVLFPAPTEYSGTTDEHGDVRLRVAKDSEGIGILPSAAGYQSYWAQPAFPDGSSYVSGPFTEIPPWPFDHVTVTLYREPPPTVTFIVPDGFRGIVRIEEPYVFPQPRPDRPRDFEIWIEPGKTIVLKDIPPTELDQPHFRWKHADGRPYEFHWPLANDLVLPRHLWEGVLPWPDRYLDKNGVWVISVKRPTARCWELVIGTWQEQQLAMREVRRHFPGGEPLPANFVLGTHMPK